MTIRNDTRLEDFLTRVNDYGNAEGKGLNAKPSYARDVVDMAHQGVIGNDHADSVWRKYSEASARTKGSEKLRTSTAKTDKVRVSETKKLIAMGIIEWPKDVGQEPVNVFDRAVALINENHDARGSTYENLVKVARKQLDNRAAPLTDQQIVDAITPAAPETKDEQEILTALVKRMKKLHDGDEKDPTAPVYPSPELAAAIKSLEARLAALVSKQETAKMFELAAKHGANVSFPSNDAPAEQEAA